MCFLHPREKPAPGQSLQQRPLRAVDTKRTWGQIKHSRHASWHLPLTPAHPLGRTHTERSSGRNSFVTRKPLRIRLQTGPLSAGRSAKRSQHWGKGISTLRHFTQGKCVSTDDRCRSVQSGFICNDAKGDRSPDCPHRTWTDTGSHTRDTSATKSSALYT